MQRTRRSGPTRALRTVVCGVTLAAAGCAGPQRAPLPELYARHPDLEPLDTRPLHGRVIVIDPGHGGTYAGSRGVGDTREADVNLGVALYLWGLLRDAGADVHLTRASDRDFLTAPASSLSDDLAARVAVIDSLQPDVFLSLHHNSNAELDRERNRIETYYRLDDAGPSYDLARSIHRRLAQNLGIDEARLLPGNYYVLRNADTAAVLGEASYLSNPEVESRLRLAEKQRLEAESYFLGLLDYFARGIPTISATHTSGDTLHPGEQLRLRVGADGIFDPLATELRIDGRRTAPAYQSPHGEVIVVADAELSPGAHEIELRARNTDGNAARVWRHRLFVHAPPTRLLAHQEPDPASPGSDVRIRLRLVDAWGRAVADSLPVRIEASGATILHTETVTQGGDVLAAVRVGGGGSATLHVRADTLRHPVAVRLNAAVPRQRFVRCVDAARGTAVRGAWVRCGHTPAGTTDRAGGVLVHFDCDSLRVDRSGYVPWSSAPARTGVVSNVETVRLAPTLAGHLAGRTLVLDPGGEGLEPSAADLGVSAAELAFDVARWTASWLDACGARVYLTRGATHEVPESERVRTAIRHDAEWFVRIDATLEPGRGAAVLHYPGSSAGEQLALAVSRWLVRRGVSDSVRVASDTRTVLQQTPCPAVVVQLPGPPTAAARPAWAHVDSLRRAAYALFVGVRAGVSPEVEAWPALEGTVDPELGPSRALVLLDGGVSLRPDAAGHFRFECVPVGEHRLTLLLPGQVRELSAETTPTRTPRVHFAVGSNAP